MTDRTNLEITARAPGQDSLLTPAALAFLAAMAARFTPERDRLLGERVRRQAAIDAGASLDFLPETRAVREGDWKGAPLPAEAQFELWTGLPAPVEIMRMAAEAELVTPP